MEDSRLLPLVERAAAARRDAVAAAASEPSRVEFMKRPDYQEAHSALTSALRDDGRLAGREGDVALHSMWVRFDASSATHWLANRALTVGAEQAAAELTRFLEAATFPYIVWVALSGVFTDHDVQFAPNLWLRYARDDLPEVLRPTGLLRSLLHLPTAVLVEQRDQRYERKPEGAERGFRSAPLESDDVINCLSLVRIPAVPFIVGLLCEPADWVPLQGYLHFPLQGYLHFPRSLESTGHQTRLWREHTERAQELYHRFRDLPDGFRKRLRLPMWRLNAAMRRRHDADKAIDLGIALEALLLRGSDPTDKRYQVAVRCAFLLGRSPAAKHRAFQLAGVIYHLRNRAVHRGEIDSGDLTAPFKGSELEAVLQDGGRLVAEAASRFIEARDEPDWDALVLGPRPEDPAEP